ncbi:transthyretin-like family domain-containing protein [Ditylenchus destructor]|uniref:Transthyretin-like family domain-containing protein n=1 Tax=Ditylenchus destructor TaxID=166010 RepID=A0AAD4N6A5_9BILA|nr:transthyretin-like family domain-containing protein [Ditylenchus destructor]
MITNLFLCLIFTSLLLINNQHSVNSEVIPPRATAVKGELVCGNVSVADAVVQLFRINSDDKKEVLDTRIVSPAGLFELNANTYDRPANESDIIPTIKIYHRCGQDAKKSGYRRFQIGIPREFVNYGRVAKNKYDIGKLNLEVVYPGEVVDKNFQRN